jgi:ABC-type uncharacterized transport system permease subunit
MPTTGQFVLLAIAAAMLALSWGLSLARLWGERPGLPLASRAALVAGIVASLAVLAWHALQRRDWIPVHDNFDALIWLGTLLALFVLYVQGARRLGAIDWFVLPVAVLLVLGAGLAARVEYHDYVHSTWGWVHRITAYGGAVAFAIAAAAGAMYVLSSRRLRSKQPVGPYLGSLERLEHLTMTSVRLGFALLTVSAITGGVRMIADGQTTSTTKIVLTVVIWLVYALVLHAPINPSFRGRKAAVLSMVGFALMVGVIIAIQLLPGGEG